MRLSASMWREVGTVASFDEVYVPALVPTPLAIASRSNHFECVKRLIAAGASTSLPTELLKATPPLHVLLDFDMIMAKKASKNSDARLVLKDKDINTVRCEKQVKRSVQENCEMEKID